MRRSAPRRRPVTAAAHHRRVGGQVARVQRELRGPGDAVGRHRDENQAKVPLYEGLRIAQEGTGSPGGLRHPRGGEGGHRRVHRGVRQPRPTVLRAGVRCPGRVRAGAPPNPPLNAVHFSWGTPVEPDAVPRQPRPSRLDHIAGVDACVVQPLHKRYARRWQPSPQVGQQVVAGQRPLERNRIQSLADGS